MSQNILEALDNLAALSADIDELTAAINAAVQCCSDGPGGRSGQAVDDPGKGSIDVDIGLGQQFPDQPTYYAAKCQIANLIFDQIRHTPAWLYDNLGDLLTGTFGGMTAGLVAHALLGPIGWGSFAVELTITAMAAYIVSYTISFADIVDALDYAQEDLVTALYNAGSATDAKQRFLTIMGAASPALGSVELQFLGILLNNKLLNELFSPAPETLLTTPTSDITCGATLQVWTFDTGLQSWTFRDESTANASASVAHDASAESLKLHLEITAGGSYRTTQGVNVSPTVSIAVAAGNSVVVDFSATSDGVVVYRYLKAIYDDAREFTALLGAHSSAGSLTLNLPESGTLETIEVTTGRSNGSGTTGYDFYTDTLEVRVQ